MLRCIPAGTCLVLVVGCVVGFVTPAAADQVADATTTARVQTAYLYNQHLNPFDLKASTRDGVVTLTGTVPSEVERDLAERLAKGVDGVKRVVNKVAVRPRKVSSGPQVAPRPPATTPKSSGKAAPGPSRGSTGGWLAQAKADYRASEQQAASLRRQAREIRREADSWASKFEQEADHEVQQARQRLAEAERNVQEPDAPLIHRLGQTYQTEKQRVSAEAEQASKEANRLMARAGHALTKEWLEKRIELGIVLNPNVNIWNMNVEVHHGVATLTGTVRNQAEKDVAQNIARHVAGIRSVHDELKVVTPHG